MLQTAARDAHITSASTNAVLFSVFGAGHVNQSRQGVKPPPISFVLQQLTS
jgi:hypothetical protein